MNNIYLVFPIMTFFGALGGFFFKKGAENVDNFLSLIFNFKIYIGGFFYVTAAILNIFVLKYLPYSIVLPLTAMTYIWTMILAKIALAEKITSNKIIGTILIILGSLLIAI